MKRRDTLSHLAGLAFALLALSPSQAVPQCVAGSSSRPLPRSHVFSGSQSPECEQGQSFAKDSVIRGIVDSVTSDTLDNLSATGLAVASDAVVSSQGPCQTELNGHQKPSKSSASATLFDHVAARSSPGVGNAPGGPAPNTCTQLNARSSSSAPLDKDPSPPGRGLRPAASTSSPTGASSKDSAMRRWRVIQLDSAGALVGQRWQESECSPCSTPSRAQPCPTPPSPPPAKATTAPAPPQPPRRGAVGSWARRAVGMAGAVSVQPCLGRMAGTADYSSIKRRRPHSAPLAAFAAAPASAVEEERALRALEQLDEEDEEDDLEEEEEEEGADGAEEEAAAAAEQGGLEQLEGGQHEEGGGEGGQVDGARKEGWRRGWRKLMGRGRQLCRAWRRQRRKGGREAGAEQEEGRLEVLWEALSCFQEAESVALRASEDDKAKKAAHRATLVTRTLQNALRPHAVSSSSSAARGGGWVRRLGVGLAALCPMGVALLLVLSHAQRPEPTQPPTAAIAPPEPPSATPTSAESGVAA